MNLFKGASVMKKRMIAIIAAAALLVSAAGCTALNFGEPTQTTAATSATDTAVTSPTEAPFTPREVTVKPASIDSIIESAQEYLGVSVSDLDWEKKLENGSNVPSVDDEDYIFIYPEKLLDAIKAENLLTDGEYIAENIKINMYRTAEDGAALKSNESVELYLTVTRYTGIGNINENQPSFFRRFKDGIELGSTGGTYPPEAGFVAVTGDTFAIFKAFGEYEYRYLYGDDMMLTGNFRINTDNIDDFDKKTLDDIRCFFESLGIENPLVLLDK